MSENLDELLKSLKITKYRITNHSLWTYCLNPDHDDKNIGSFSIDLHIGGFNCFSCGYHGNIIQLLSLSGLSYAKSFYLWRNLQEVKLELPAKPIDQYLINFYDGLSSYALERVDSQVILEEYHVGSDEKGNPVFRTKDIHGWNSIWVRENGNYYLIEPLNAKRTGCIFGEDLPPTDYTVLTEGPFDAMAVRKYTGYKAVCGFGTSLSKAQLRKLNGMGNLIVFMDGDNAGIYARNKICEQLQYKGDLFVCGGYEGDPDELGDLIPKIIENKKSVAGYKFWNAPRSSKKGSPVVLKSE